MNRVRTLNKSKSFKSCSYCALWTWQPICFSLLSHLLCCGTWSNVFYLAELGLCCLLKIALSPSSHSVPSGIWASGILVMYYIFHEYLTRILQGSWALQKLLFKDLLQCTLIHHLQTHVWAHPRKTSLLPKWKISVAAICCSSEKKIKNTVNWERLNGEVIL